MVSVLVAVVAEEAALVVAEGAETVVALASVGNELPAAGAVFAALGFIRQI